MSTTHGHALRINPETGATLPCACGSVPTGFKNMPTGEYRDGRRVVKPEIVWGPDSLDQRTGDAVNRGERDA